MMIDNPLISVIVPVYHVEAYLEKCIKSIIAQTYKNLEIILVDDGSDDGCPQICDEWAHRDSRIKVIHKKNGGLSDARNAGLELAKGVYIGFVDSDDYIDCTFYEKLYKALVKGNADLSMCNYKMVDCNGNDDKYDNNNLPIHDEVLLGKEVFIDKILSGRYGYWVVAWNKLYKKELIVGKKFIVGKYHEDEYFFNSVMPICKRVACIEQPLYYYVQRSGSIMESGGHVLDKVGALSERTRLYLEKDVKPSVVYKSLYKDLQSLLVSVEKDLKNVKRRNDNYDNIKLFRDVSKIMSMQPIGAIKKCKCVLWALSPEWACSVFSSINKITRRASVGKKLVTYHLQQRKYDAILIDTPTHKNLGDHAIVLAEQQLLTQCGIKSYELTATQIDGRESKYAAVTPMNQYILVPGGGFLGALWPKEEERFRRILQAFKKHKIIVFPQTVSFDLTTPEGRKYLEESQQIYASHPDLTIFVRERRSYAFMQQYFPTVKCLIVPDIVTLLNTHDITQHRKGILFCMRRDLEKALGDVEQQEMLNAVQAQYPDEIIEFTDTVIDYDVMPEKREEEVDRKLTQFSGARLIVTDRLHGMIFAALTHTPCIAMSNSNGKVKAVYEWIKNNDYVRFANSTVEFKQQLQNLDVSQRCIYDRKLVEHEFEPLFEELRKLQK